MPVTNFKKDLMLCEKKYTLYVLLIMLYVTHINNGNS